MKKILISVSIIAAAAVVVVGGTIAYFSDTETSTGNTFTAGSIDLKVDNTSYLNGELNPDTSWTERDLTTVEKFFNFTDLKPGDNGEDTISLRVYSNDAWACVTFKDLTNDDVTCTEPEDADDLPQTPGCWVNFQAGEGELAQQLYFTFWKDDGDNIYESGETLLLTNIQGPASDVLNGKTYPIADATFSIAGVPGTPLDGDQTYYIGKAWCFGTMTVNPVEQGGITCNGQPVNNASQSDQVTGTIEFYAVQSRNNTPFYCGQR